MGQATSQKTMETLLQILLFFCYPCPPEIGVECAPMIMRIDCIEKLRLKISEGDPEPKIKCWIGLWFSILWAVYSTWKTHKHSKIWWWWWWWWKADMIQPSSIIK